MRYIHLFLLLLTALSFQQCGGVSGGYTLSGISIDPGTKTYYVAEFKNNAYNSPVTLDITVRETLDNKIRTETNLTNEDKEPDIEFKGSIVDYVVEGIAPKPGEASSLNKLTIRLAVEYIVYKENGEIDEEKGWKKNFFHFFEFSSSQNLSDIEEEAITAILEDVTERIFNKAFANW